MSRNTECTQTRLPIITARGDTTESADLGKASGPSIASSCKNLAYHDRMRRGRTEHEYSSTKLELGFLYWSSAFTALIQQCLHVYSSLNVDLQKLCLAAHK